MLKYSWIHEVILDAETKSQKLKYLRTNEGSKQHIQHEKKIQRLKFNPEIKRLVQKKKKRKKLTIKLWYTIMSKTKERNCFILIKLIEQLANYDYIQSS